MAEVRRLGRTWALSILYAVEYVDARGYLYARFVDLVPRAGDEPEAFSFARDLADGVLVEREELDVRLKNSSPRWRVQRMAMIDRNILRLATFELFHRPDVPPRVVINEAVELAKRFGAEQTRSFVNGILQQVCTDNAISLRD